MSSSTSVESTTTSSNNQELISIPPSGPVVVSPCLTKTEPESLPLSDKELSICLMALVANLQRLVLCGDTWWLAHNSTERQLSEIMDPETYALFKVHLEQARQRRFAANPMSSMF